MTDRRIAWIVKQAQDLPGQQLFQYLDEAGDRRGVSSTDVNAYIRAAAGGPFSSKHFRTWGGTVLALMRFSMLEPPDSRRGLAFATNQVIDEVSRTLGNTRTVCRKCYIHPQVLRQEDEGVGDLARRVEAEALEADRPGRRLECLRVVVPWRCRRRCLPCASRPSPRRPARAGQFTQASRVSRASRNTSASARARSTSSPLSFCSFSRRSCDFSTSLAVFACRKVAPPPEGDGRPCSRSVSPTAVTAAFGTGFSFGAGDDAARTGARAPRCFDGSVGAARRASEASASIEPSGCSTSRPAVFAFWIAPRERSARAA